MLYHNCSASTNHSRLFTMSWPQLSHGVWNEMPLEPSIEDLDRAIAAIEADIGEYEPRLNDMYARRLTLIAQRHVTAGTLPAMAVEVTALVHRQRIQDRLEQEIRERAAQRWAQAQEARRSRSRSPRPDRGEASSSRQPH